MLRKKRSRNGNQAQPDNVAKKSHFSVLFRNLQNEGQHFAQGVKCVRPPPDQSLRKWRGNPTANQVRVNSQSK